MVLAAELQAIRGDKSTCWVARNDLVESGQVKTPADFKGRRGAGQAWGIGSSNDGYLAKTLAPYGLSNLDVEGTKPEEIKERLRRLPFGRLGKAEDIVGPLSSWPPPTRTGSRATCSTPRGRACWWSTAMQMDRTPGFGSWPPSWRAAQLTSSSRREPR
jgi:hypothetical protein